LRKEEKRRITPYDTVRRRRGWETEEGRIKCDHLFIEVISSMKWNEKESISWRRRGTEKRKQNASN